ncbi:hypothetical protein N7494_010451 [Penicillium frequentans]|uniref:RNase III domain-containing protein n=1 Tax=Penicillium frequentans TaxID=3151616 RepID=A0AAD6CID8_9EURO|nr:hypothetical protein N7494_010451 [Penicillium glabrum]
MAIYIPLPSDEMIHDFEHFFLEQSYRFSPERMLIREGLQCPNPFNPAGNAILALAGDAILRQSLVDQGRARGMSPEEIQNVIEKVASNVNLYRKGLALGLDPYIVKNPSQRNEVAGRIVMATTMEAILGAVYYDSNKNIDACERVMSVLGLSWPE